MITYLMNVNLGEAEMTMTGKDADCTFNFHKGEMVISKGHEDDEEYQSVRSKLLIGYLRRTIIIGKNSFITNADRSLGVGIYDFENEYKIKAAIFYKPSTRIISIEEIKEFANSNIPLLFNFAKELEVRNVKTIFITDFEENTHLKLSYVMSSRTMMRIMEDLNYEDSSITPIDSNWIKAGFKPIGFDENKNNKYILSQIKKNKMKKYICVPSCFIVPYYGYQYYTAKLIDQMVDSNMLLSYACDDKSSTSMFKKSIYSHDGETAVIPLKHIQKGGMKTMFYEDGSVTLDMLHLLLEIVRKNEHTMVVFAVKGKTIEQEVIEACKYKGVFVQSLLPDLITSTKKIKHILNSMAKRDGFSRYTGIVDDKPYLLPEIEEMYSNWSRKAIFDNIFNNTKTGSKSKKAPDLNDAYSTLKSMIGLADIKDIIQQIISNFKMQKILVRRNIQESIPCRHMAFYGNPGTAKTSVAKLFATILANEGIIEKDKIIFAGRSDLVSEYLGQTAIKTTKVINSAKGGVLFIDEAYSLVEQKGLYGDECINTLVEQMDLVKDSTIIIFAGYHDKMQDLLNKNEGLRSRIAFHVDFKNYTEEECLDIFKLMAENKKVILTNEAIEIAKEQIHNAIGKKDFGNGRFCRTLLEQAMIQQSNRIMGNRNKDPETLTTKELTTIEGYDMKDINVSSDNSKSKDKIGFKI